MFNWLRKKDKFEPRIIGKITAVRNTSDGLEVQATITDPDVLEYIRKESEFWEAYK